MAENSASDRIIFREASRHHNMYLYHEGISCQELRHLALQDVISYANGGRGRWQDPLNLYYDKHEIYDEIQMKLKEAGGSVLPLFTICPDVNIEMRLLNDYWRWVEAQCDQALADDQMLEDGPSQEELFYQNLLLGPTSDYDCLQKEGIEAALDLSYDPNVVELTRVFEAAGVDFKKKAVAM